MLVLNKALSVSHFLVTPFIKVGVCATLSHSFSICLTPQGSLQQAPNALKCGPR